VQLSLRALAREFSEVSPLRHPRFRAFYLGSVSTSIAYTMLGTVAAWLMATLTPSPIMVALVQTATTAPALLFGFVAGALADIASRRRIIIVTQVALFASGATLGIAALLGLAGPVLLLLLIFTVGAGFVFYQPAQQASINELVGRSELSRAVALGAVAFNVARAVGPALAGIFAAWLGSGLALILAAVFFLPMALFMLRGARKSLALPGVPERLASGVQSGLRFARHSPAMRAFVLHNLTFALCASAFWAMLPLIARDLLKTDASGFGLLSATFGFGAVVGAMAMPRLLQKQSLHAVVASSIALWVASTVLLAVAFHKPFALVGAFGTGMAWVGVLASLSAGTQSTAPAWVRARAVGINLVAVQASIAIGSIVWGTIASFFGIRWSLGAAAAAMIVIYALTRRYTVTMGSEADTTPGARMADMVLASEPDPDDGPVLIQLEYRIDTENRDAFLRAIEEVGPTRRRNGATSWRVFRDLANDGRFVERFIIASWAEYVRLRTRMTVADRTVQDRVEALQRAEVPVRVSRLLGVALEHGD